MTSNKPLVAITGRKTPDSVENGSLCGARRLYLEAVIDAGGIPVILPLMESSAAALELLEHCDGVLVPGGEDIDPRHYGETPHPLLGTTDPDRDAHELAVIREARARKLPLLGICRGHQMINVAYGGTLYQDIGTQFASRQPHPRGQFEELAHELHLCPGSILSNLLDTSSLTINSLHHQAVKMIGTGLRSAGESPDGLNEALEGTDPEHWVLSVQCHPEALFSKVDSRWKALFAAFVREASKHRSAR
jgi:putative glutamine amidotransferase